MAKNLLRALLIMRTTSNVRLHSLYAMVLAASCSPNSAEDWYPSSESDGKADAITLIKGSEIPSTNVDDNAYYLASRRIDSLREVGVMNPARSRLVDRIDGILAGSSPDGRFHVAELVRMEQDLDDLPAEEQRAFNGLWLSLKAPNPSMWPGTNPVFLVTQSALGPDPAVIPSVLAINSLPNGIATAARRLQELQFDSDGNSATITITDLEAGLAMPSEFTPEELADLAAIKNVFLARAVSEGERRIMVQPAPREQRWTFFQPMKLNGLESLRYVEHRRFSERDGLRTSFVGTRTSEAIEIEGPATHKVVFINVATGEETVAGAGPIPDSVTPGQHIYEIWELGAWRTSSNNLNLPEATTVDLDEYVDMPVRFGGSQLIRNLSRAEAITETQGLTWYTEHIYDTRVVAPTTPIDPMAVAKTSTPEMPLPVGRYPMQSIEWGRGGLYVWSGPVLYVIFQSGPAAELRLLPATHPPTLAKVFHGEANGITATFFPVTQRLVLRSQGAVVLDWLFDATMREFE